MTYFVTVPKFYKQTNEIKSLSYDTYGETMNCSIVEYEIVDNEATLSYADKMAAPVYEP